jgi:hypothetical protein
MPETAIGGNWHRAVEHLSRSGVRREYPYGDFVFERDSMSPRQVRGLKKLPVYIASQIDRVLEEGPPHTPAGTIFSLMTRSTPPTPSQPVHRRAACVLSQSTVQRDLLARESG